MLIPILLGVTLFTFIVTKLTPGDPAIIILGPKATPERVADLRDKLGLNDPFWVQYGRYVWDAMHGDLGNSYRGNTPVMREILDRVPSTLQLTVAAMLIGVTGGVLTGMLAATSKRKWVDGTSMLATLLGLSIPYYWLAIMLVIIFGAKLQWVEVAGGTGIKNLILPAFALSLGSWAVLARLTRSSILEVIREDYVRTARAKGLNQRRVNYRHVLRNALVPVVTVMGLQFASLMAGAVFTESVFARPGLGRFAVNAISARDYPQIMGVVLFVAVVYVVLNLAVDILYGILDPRIRYD
jgi:peptide/nickel transport system permease protein